MAGLLVYRSQLVKKERAEAQVKVPVPMAPRPELTDEEKRQQRLLEALGRINQHAAERMTSLKWYLFWLPFLWAIPSAIIWMILYAAR